MKRTRAADAFSSDAISFQPKDQHQSGTATPNLSPRKGRNLFPEHPPWMEAEEAEGTETPRTMGSLKKPNAPTFEPKGTKREPSPRKGRDLAVPDHYSEAETRVEAQPSSTQAPPEPTFDHSQKLESKFYSEDSSQASVGLLSNQAIADFFKGGKRDNFAKLSQMHQKLLFTALKDRVSDAHEHSIYLKFLGPKAFQRIKERGMIYSTYQQILEDRLALYHSVEEKIKLQQLKRQVMMKLECIEFEKAQLQEVRADFEHERDHLVGAIKGHNGEDSGSWSNFLDGYEELFEDIEIGVRVAQNAAEKHAKRKEETLALYEEMPKLASNLKETADKGDMLHDGLLEGLLEALKKSRISGDGSV